MLKDNTNIVLDFFKQILPDDNIRSEFLNKLKDCVNDEKYYIFILHGSGSNGKSVLYNFLQNTITDLQKKSLFIQCNILPNYTPNSENVYVIYFPTKFTNYPLNNNEMKYEKDILAKLIKHKSQLFDILN